jgi:hypothetical protein
MSTNRSATTGTRFRLWPQYAAVLLLAWTELAWSPAHAATENESAVSNSPMPHEKLGAGRESVKVHWVRLQGHVEGKSGHAALLDELKAAVQQCVRAPIGGQSRPPKVWPDYVESIQSDTYAAANRTITYTTTLMYGLNPKDCSLLETRTVEAKLASAWGNCEIDFIHKTAHGVCDARAHADAPAVVHVGLHAPISGGRAGAANGPSQAALAAMEKAMKQFGLMKTAERKTIAGIECDVQTNALSGTLCVSRGGSFAGWPAGPGAAGSSMNLELTNVGGADARARRAQLDATVNAAVFAPYLAGDFKVTNIARRK